MTTRAPEDQRAAGGPAARRRPLLIAAAIGGVLLVAIGLRFVTRSNLWLDEALTVNIARLPVRDIPDALRRDGAPPLYYVLLHYWMQLFGEGDTAVRALSGVFAVATLPAMYFAGRRLGGRVTAWTAVVLLAVSPFAIRYATENRMYALAMFLVAWGYLALVRALERPNLGRLALVATTTAALLYSHNWTWWLLTVVGLFVLGVAWKAREAARRRAAWWVAGALVVGGVLYLPWLAVLKDQLGRTGTPWADARVPWSGLMDFLDGLGGSLGTVHGEALVLGTILVVLILLGVFGAAIDARRIEVDLRTRPTVRWEAAVAFGTLALGLTLSWAEGTAFVPRYGAVVVPLLVLVVAVGLTTFRGVAWGVLVGLIVLLGIAGGVRNVREDRTQAGAVASLIRMRARPGDVVVYCPDQLGPSVHRLLGDHNSLVEVTFPDLARPEFVNWVHYRARVDAANANAVAQRVVDRANGRAIWYVVSPGYRSVEGQCEALGAALGARRASGRTLVGPDDNVFEMMGLIEYPAS